MAQVRQLPCDANGICMLCKCTPAEEDKLTCTTCVTPWHVSCLSSASAPETLASSLHWECPDCINVVGGEPADHAGDYAGGGDHQSGELVAAIKAIEADATLTERQKAERRQELLSGHVAGGKEKEEGGGTNDVLDIIGENFKCSFCIQLPERPVTTPCGHNFCLKCFEKWIAQGKHTCAKCRKQIPPKMASLPRINSTLVAAIRIAKMSKFSSSGGPPQVIHYVSNQDRPEKAYVTNRAKRAGMANAASGRIFVTIPEHHFGPILAENDPERGLGVLVGEYWNSRLEARQWGVHFPHISGIAGQCNNGAQSVVLSGGYEDDEDHGEWFLYTGSGGRDLSGNRRTNKAQSFDQEFVSYNQSLRISCLKGYPVRVVRSCKEKRSSYAPEQGLRYDGIYRVEMCWRKVGKQGFKVCRYLFVRCDNAPAPWTSDDHGDRPRPLPLVSELKHAVDISERMESPSWEYEEEEDCWKWKKPPPQSKKLRVTTGNPMDREKARGAVRNAQNIKLQVKLLKEFSCLLCKKVMSFPLTTPCAHNFCKSCLEGKFVGQSFTTERTRGGRTLRSRKNVMKCPECSHEITDFLHDPQVNRELMDVIEKLQGAASEEEKMESSPSQEEVCDVEELSNPLAESKIEERNEMKVADANIFAEQGPKRTYKRKQSEASDGLPTADDNKQEKRARRGKPMGGSKSNKKEGVEDNKGNEADDGKKHTTARRGRPKGGSKTNQKEADKNEDNDSPSSPLQLQSVEDGHAVSSPLERNNNNEIGFSPVPS